MDKICDIILEGIKLEVVEAEFYSTLLDETKDLSKKEEVSLVIRYFFNGDAHEEFLGFKVADELERRIIGNIHIDELDKLNDDQDADSF